MQIDDALVGAAAEEEFRVTLLQDEGPVHEDVQPGKHLREVRIGLDLLQGESGPAPDGLAGFLLDAPGQFRERIGLVERIAAGETHIGHRVRLDDVQDLIDLHPVPRIEVPRLRIMAPFARMLAPSTIDGRPETRAVRHCLFEYPENPDAHDYSWMTRSLSSASLPEFQRLVVPTR